MGLQRCHILPILYENETVSVLGIDMAIMPQTTGLAA